MAKRKRSHKKVVKQEEPKLSPEVQALYDEFAPLSKPLYEQQKLARKLGDYALAYRLERKLVPIRKEFWRKLRALTTEAEAEGVSRP